MSTVITSYIGAYLEIDTKVQEYTKKFYACSNPNCRDFEEQNPSEFCPSCGTLIKLISKTEKKLVDIDSDPRFENILSEVITNENSKIYLFSDDGNHYDGRYSNTVEILPSHIESTINLITTKYATELKQLKDIFGPFGVRVKFGLVTYVY